MNNAVLSTPIEIETGVIFVEHTEVTPKEKVIVLTKPRLH